MTIAEQVLLALAGDFVPYAVNVAATDVSETVRPFMSLAEQLGRFFACLHEGLPDGLEIQYRGELAGVSTGILTLSILKGLFASTTEEPVSYVNAPQLAEQRGLHVQETSTASHRTTEPRHRPVGHPLGRRHAHRGRCPDRAPRRHGRRHAVEVPPTPHMLVVRNDDRPGMIGVVGVVLGDAGISISSMAVGPSEEPGRGRR